MFIDWFSHMCISNVDEHICRIGESLIAPKTFAGARILEGLQLLRICVEHKALPLFTHLLDCLNIISEKYCIEKSIDSEFGFWFQVFAGPYVLITSYYLEILYRTYRIYKPSC